jgi:hypothetical protein
MITGKHIACVVAITGCAQNADIGLTGGPIGCKSAAAGYASGTVMTADTRIPYTFGPIVTVTRDAVPTVRLNDGNLTMVVGFPCGAPAVGTFAIQPTASPCPYANGEVAGDRGMINVLGHSGTVIVDTTVGCLAGRYDVVLGPTTGAFVNLGEVSGWFSVP